MKHNRALILLAIAAVAAAGVLAGSFWQKWSATGSLTAAGASLAVAAEEPLKAGMVDPQTGKKIKYWVAPMDPTYIRDEPGKSPMGMDLVPVYEEDGGEKEPTSTIRIDPVTIQNMGIRTAPVIRKPVTKTIRTFGNVTYDETRMVSVNTKFDGWIEKLHVNFVGERIKRGQPLFDIYSPGLVTTQEEYLLALKQYRSLKDSPFVHVRDSAERLMAASRKRLQYWDMSDSQIRQLETTGQVRKAITIFSPSGGVVIQKSVVEGQFVKAGENHYQIADLSTVWVDVDIYEYELPYVKKGMPARMELSYVPGERFQGEVLYIYPYLSKETRTARLRLAFPNTIPNLSRACTPTFDWKPNSPARIWSSHRRRLSTQACARSFLSAKARASSNRVRSSSVSKSTGTSIRFSRGCPKAREIVISAQFMLDSESRLREAVQKMLEVRQAGGTDAPADDDLDMSGLSMDDELDMTGISMEEADTSSPQ